MRDLTVLELDAERVLVVACDSLGSIGDRPHDVYRVPAATAAHFAVRVPLLELLAAGARPELVVDALSVEMDPTGTVMIEEIRRMASAVGLGPDRITGSTEDNVPAAATGIGVTVLGTAAAGTLRPGTSQPGDTVLCFGLPTSAPGDRIEIGDARMLTLESMAALAASPRVHDILPVGSRGVGFELGELARTAGLEATSVPSDLDLGKSGGPASCALVSMPPGDVDEVRALVPADLSVTRVAELRAAA